MSTYQQELSDLFFPESAASCNMWNFLPVVGSLISENVHDKAKRPIETMTYLYFYYLISTFGFLLLHFGHLSCNFGELFINTSPSPPPPSLCKYTRIIG